MFPSPYFGFLLHFRHFSVMYYVCTRYLLGDLIPRDPHEPLCFLTVRQFFNYTGFGFAAFEVTEYQVVHTSTL